MKRPSDKQQEHHWLEQYLHEPQNSDLQAVVDAERRRDPALNADVEWLGQAHTLLDDAFAQQQALETLRRCQQQHRWRQQRLRLARRTLAWAAATGLVLIVYLSTSSIVLPSSENDVEVTRSLTDSDSVPGVRNDTVYRQFLEGQANLLEGQYALAVPNFERVARAPDIRPFFREAAQWHLAIAYLRSNQPDKAERIYRQFAQCVDCEYPIGTVNRVRLWWQIKWAKWLPKP
ncbi:hypothetical protein GCM10027578_16940 [Spirosoma luteolum]